MFLFETPIFQGSLGEVAGWGVAFSALLTYLIQRQKLKSSDMHAVVKLQQAELKETRKENKLINDRLESINRRLEVLQASRFQSSVPQWVKDKKGRLIYANAAYINQFLEPLGLKYEDVEDKTDLQIWPSKELARMYRDNDRKVMREGRGFYFVNKMKFADHTVNYKAHIDPFFISGKVAGVIGLAVPLDDTEVVNN